MNLELKELIKKLAKKGLDKAEGEGEGLIYDLTGKVREYAIQKHPQHIQAVADAMAVIDDMAPTLASSSRQEIQDAISYVWRGASASTEREFHNMLLDELLADARLDDLGGREDERRKRRNRKVMLGAAQALGQIAAQAVLPALAGMLR